MTTKEKILTTALHLFNQQGTDPITTRHIAKEMGISHGNLCYHYARKEEIITALYHNLVEELNREISALQEGELGIPLLHRATRTTFTIQYKYKFILQEMVGIMRKIDPIRVHFKALYEQRKKQFTHILQYLISKGLIKEESIPGQYDNFIAQFYIIGDFWVSEAEILFYGSNEEKLKYYTQIAFSLIIPYLTDKGLSAYRDLLSQEQ